MTTLWKLPLSECLYETFNTYFWFEVHGQAEIKLLTQSQRIICRIRILLCNIHVWQKRPTIHYSYFFFGYQGNTTAVFYTDESIAASIPKQPVVSSNNQQQEPKQQSQQQPQAKQANLDVLRGQVREVTNIMRSNVDEISKRGEKLEELETRSGRLEDLVSFKILRIAIQGL